MASDTSRTSAREAPNEDPCDPVRSGVVFSECEMDIVRVDDALDLVTASVEQGTHRLLIDADRLPDDFFDLKTRFAGEFVQKLQNYRLKVAIVLPPDADHGERFGELVREARTGSGFRFFSDRAGAEVWLRE